VEDIKFEGQFEGGFDFLSKMLPAQPAAIDGGSKC